MSGGRTFLVAAAWCCLLFFTLQSGLLSLALGWPTAATNVWCIGAVQLLVVGSFAGAFVTVHRNESGLTERDHWSVAFAVGPSWRGIVWGLAAAVAFHAPVEGVREWVEQLSPTPAGERLAQLQLLSHDTVLRTVSLFLVVGLLGPLIEEAFFRGCLFRYLERKSGGIAAWLFTSVAFTLTHAAYRDWPSLLVIALVLGYLRLHTGSLWPGFAMHATFNSQSLLDAVTDSGGLESATASRSLFVHAVSLLFCVLIVAAIGRQKPRVVNA